MENPIQVHPKRHDLTGTWIQEIPEVSGELNKTDIVTCEHSEDELKGKIKRLIPESERFKRWYFAGKMRGAHVFGMFWQQDHRKLPYDYGTLHLTLMAPELLEGFLIKPYNAGADARAFLRWGTKPVPLKWTKNLS